MKPLPPEINQNMNMIVVALVMLQREKETNSQGISATMQLFKETLEVLHVPKEYFPKTDTEWGFALGILSLKVNENLNNEVQGLLDLLTGAL